MFSLPFEYWIFLKECKLSSLVRFENKKFFLKITFSLTLKVNKVVQCFNSHSYYSKIYVIV